MPPVDLSALAHAVLNHTPPGCHSGRCEAGSRNARRLAELVLAGAGDDAEPVTLGWLRAVGFLPDSDHGDDAVTLALDLLYGRTAEELADGKGTGKMLVIDATGTAMLEEYDGLGPGVCRTTDSFLLPGMPTRGHVRRLCASLGVTLPEVTGHE